MKFEHWSYIREHSPHHHWRVRFWRLSVHFEAWINRYPMSTSRVCARIQGHYDRKHGRGWAVEYQEQPR